MPLGKADRPAAKVPTALIRASQCDPGTSSRRVRWTKPTNAARADTDIFARTAVAVAKLQRQAAGAVPASPGFLAEPGWLNDVKKALVDGDLNLLFDQHANSRELARPLRNRAKPYAKTFGRRHDLAMRFNCLWASVRDNDCLHALECVMHAATQVGGLTPVIRMAFASLWHRLGPANYHGFVVNQIEPLCARNQAVLLNHLLLHTAPVFCDAMLEQRLASLWTVAIKARNHQTLRVLKQYRPKGTALPFVVLPT